MELKKIKEIFSFEKGSLQSSKCTAGEYNFIRQALNGKNIILMIMNVRLL